MEKKNVILLCIYVAIFITLCIISSYVIRFNTYDRFVTNRSMSQNIPVAIYYFLFLPIVSAAPIFIYQKLITSRKTKKSKASDYCVVQSHFSEESDGILQTLRHYAYDDFWTVISSNINLALEYMLSHPDEFCVVTDQKDKPDWPDCVYEIVCVNGERLFIYMHMANFMVSLDKCVKSIKEKLQS